MEIGTGNIETAIEEEAAEIKFIVFFSCAQRLEIIGIELKIEPVLREIIS